MKLILSIIILTLLIPLQGIAQKTDITEFDGNNWRTWSYERKINFISGFLAGSGYVVDQNFSYIEWADGDYDHGKAINLLASFQLTEKDKKNFTYREVFLLMQFAARREKIPLWKYSIEKITNLQIVDGLNVFYDDFKNRTIKLAEAIYVVKKQIEGASPEEIEALTQWLRTPDRDLQKRYYIDKKGKREFVDFP